MLSNLKPLSSLRSVVFSGICATLLKPILLQLFIQWLRSSPQNQLHPLSDLEGSSSSINTISVWILLGIFLFYALLNSLPKYYFITMESSHQRLSHSHLYTWQILNDIFCHEVRVDGFALFHCTNFYQEVGNFPVPSLKSSISPKI